MTCGIPIQTRWNHRLNEQAQVIQPVRAPTSTGGKTREPELREAKLVAAPPAEFAAALGLRILWRRLRGGVAQLLGNALSDVGI